MRGAAVGGPWLRCTACGSVVCAGATRLPPTTLQVAVHRLRILRNISALSAFPSATAPSARGYLAALPAGAPLPYAYMLACAPNLHQAVSPSASSAAVRVYGHRTVLRVCSLERLVC